MEKFWLKAVSVTGPVAVVGFIFVLFMKHLFDERIVEIFGSDRFFYIVVGILCILAIALILTILKHKSGQPGVATSRSETKTATIENTKIIGDIVFGDKTVNRGGKSDE